MRLKRRTSPGGTDIFSSAGSLALPVGTRFEKGSVNGYYIDFTTKADDPTWPPRWLAERVDQVHVGTWQWALGCYERFLAGDGEQWREALLEASRYAVADQDADGGWPHLHRMQHTYKLEPPWLSGMAQAEAASMLVRAQITSGDERFGAAARHGLAPLYRPVAEGGVLADLDGAPFLEEYPTVPGSYVLNGEIFALFGLYDVGIGLGDAVAMEAFERAAAGLAASIRRFDNGYWSLYDLFPHLISNVSSGAYHELHINQLKALHRIYPDPELKAAVERFEHYQRSRLGPRRAFAHKAAFRILIPRNEMIGERIPWRGGAKRGWRPWRPGDDTLVLCYHALSPTWGAPLSTTPERFEEQIQDLKARGYRAVSFHEAVHGETDGKRVAITFDDAFRSVFEIAKPILDRAALTASVFVPTAFPGEQRPLAWEGTEQWLRTPDADELAPMSWAQIGELAEDGWEIGSHTRTHPRLPELDDAALAEELLESRRECEAGSGSPCRSLAYPYGAHDERVAAAARAAGYAAAGTLPTRLHTASPLRWPRIGIYNADDRGRFRRKTSPALRALRGSGLWDGVTALRRRDGSAGDSGV